MASFPELPSGNNPSLDAAGSSASSAAGLYNGLQTRLQAAAAQQATLQRQKDQDAATAQRQNFEDTMKMAAAGAVPTQTYPAGQPLPGRPTLLTPEANPAAQGAGQKVTTPAGNEYYVPTASEKDQASGKTFVPAGTLNDALVKAGRKTGQPITPEESHNILQSLNESQMDEPFDIDTSGKFQDAQGQPSAVMIGRKTGKVRMLDLSGGASTSPPATPGASANGPFNTAAQPGASSPSTPGAATDGSQDQAGSAPPAPANGFTFAPPEKADKADSQVAIQGMQGPHGGMLVHDKTSNTISEVPYPTGSKPVMTAAQTEADKDRHVRQSELQDARDTRNTEAAQRRTDAQSKVEESYVRTHEAEGIKKDSMQSMAQGYWDAKGTAPGSTYFPPRLVNGIVVPGRATVMPDRGPKYDARLNDLDTTAKGFEKTAKTHQDAQTRIEKARGWGQFAPPAAPATQGAQAAAQPVAAPAAQPTKTAPPAARAAPPAQVTKGLAPGRHTFGNGQTWQKGADGSMAYVSGGQ